MFQTISDYLEIYLSPILTYFRCSNKLDRYLNENNIPHQVLISIDGHYLQYYNNNYLIINYYKHKY
jgi:hypothetical protein